MNNVRPEAMERITTPELAEKFIAEQIDEIRAQVGDKKVLLALSGGVDSSVVAALLIKAIGRQLVCVHVNHGLMRKGESEQVVYPTACVTPFASTSLHGSSRTAAWPPARWIATPTRAHTPPTVTAS